MCISFGVFWLPFTSGFVTPRLTLSILALLTFTNLALKEGMSLPPGAPFNWNDLFVQNVQAVMFSIIALNIFCDVAEFTLACHVTAKTTNHHVKWQAPLVAFVQVLIISMRYPFS